MTGCSNLKKLPHTNSKENYCLQGSCRDYWPVWKEDRGCSSRACASPCYNVNCNGGSCSNGRCSCPSTRSGNRCQFACNSSLLRGTVSSLAQYLQLGSAGSLCNPENYKASSRSSYYDFWGAGRFSTISNAHSNGAEQRWMDSNYIGPGTQTAKLIRDGVPPLSLTDTCAIVHDLAYRLSSNSSDGLNADNAFIENLRHCNSIGEPSWNTNIAQAVASTGQFLGVTYLGGPGGEATAWDGSGAISASDKTNIAIIMNALDSTPANRKVIVNFGFLERYRNPQTGLFDFSVQR